MARLGVGGNGIDGEHDPIARTLERRMAAPLAARKPQKPLDVGLFDGAARRQLPLF